MEQIKRLLENPHLEQTNDDHHLHRKKLQATVFVMKIIDLSDGMAKSCSLIKTGWMNYMQMFILESRFSYPRLEKR